MSTATRVTEWVVQWTDDEGATHDHAFPIVLSQYGPGDHGLFKLDPPLNGEHDHILICDRGALLAYTQIEGEPEGTDVPTEVKNLVEVFAANRDGSVQTMSMVCEPITSLRRPGHGLDFTQILGSPALGYTEAT